MQNKELIKGTQGQLIKTKINEVLDLVRAAAYDGEDMGLDNGLDEYERVLKATEMVLRMYITTKPIARDILAPGAVKPSKEDV